MGRRPAAAPVHLRDAMPLISRANALTILTVNEPISAEASPDRLLARLASLGLPAKIVSLEADHSEIQPMILSAAAEEGLDLLVDGRLRAFPFAGGHSRRSYPRHVPIHDGADPDVALTSARRASSAQWISWPCAASLTSINHSALYPLLNGGYGGCHVTFIVSHCRIHQRSRKHIAAVRRRRRCSKIRHRT